MSPLAEGSEESGRSWKECFGRFQERRRPDGGLHEKGSQRQRQRCQKCYECSFGECPTIYMKFSGIKLSSLGHIKGRRAKEPDSKAVCRAGECPGRYQAVLPRRRKRSEDVLREQVAGVEVPATRTLPLHPDYRRPHQELCLLAKQSRSVIKMLQLNEIYITVPVVLVEGKGTTPKKTLEKKGKEKNVSFHPQKSENLS